jgi:hypothetical protein
MTARGRGVMVLLLTGGCGGPGTGNATGTTLAGTAQ